MPTIVASGKLHPCDGINGMTFEVWETMFPTYYVIVFFVPS